ncbi:hypothetical protein GQ55_2G388000 [Panicum hallii var. hallii]|uniref:X8 domain-containing protein n=1 Tax=Panicum hallii var. hallii TaxID=1504633 RepID=A0A2T7EX03_9POAL|nr:hypothetical protein GQ55_2G388000 [Panicum hallii var. hallii]
MLSCAPGRRREGIESMVLARFLTVVLVGAAALPLLLFSCAAEAAGGEVGVSYGRVANDLPPDQGSVVDLLRRNGITMVRIYDADPDVLKSLANTGIKVMVMLPNENLAQAARDPSYALRWVQSKVKAYYPATRIDGVAVGNEVFHARPELNPDLVQAMTNVQAALAQLNLADAIKVSTPIALDALAESSAWPPSSGRFKDEVQPVMKHMLDFLQTTHSYLSVNLFPCLTYMYQPDMNRDFALGNSNAPSRRDDVTGLVYHSLLDAQLDATYFAMEKLGFPQLRVRHTEHGCASGGGLKPGHGGRRLGDGDGGAAPSVANAQAYINNLMDRVASGRTGTPHRPDADMDVYIFALFNENQKGDGPDDIEAHYGLFYPNMQKVYEFQFPGSAAAASWCVANAAVGDARLQAALDWACGHGADCSAIQPGAACFEPNTKLAHASYAFNSYYQRNGRASGACDFAGAAYVVNQAPSGTCSATAASWCVANTAVGDARLQAALDWACGNGADCGAIQPGATCFDPDTKAAHASYAFNSYYQRKGRAAGTCDFAGAASVVYQPPKIGNCVLPSRA